MRPCAGKGPQCHVPRWSTTGTSGSRRKARARSTSAPEVISTSAGATTTTDGESSAISTWVWVTWRYSTSHRSPPGTPGTSSRR